MSKKIMKAALFKPSSIQFPYSWVGHIPFLSWFMDELRPKIFVELGTHTGNSYFTACQAVKENNLNTSCFAVDSWQGDEHSGSYDDEIYRNVLQHNDQEYRSFSNLLRMKFDEALPHFSDNSINLLHIDGLHTYDAVKHDFETWLPKMAIGGVVLFHDTKEMDRGFGVHKLWSELQKKYPLNFEFDHSHGLGILQLNNCNQDSAIKWLTAQPSEKELMKHYFSNLGAYLMELIELKKINADSKAQIETLQKSLSWRLTRPLRFLRKIVKNL
jgi:O-antigen biosynthesis protein